MEDLLKTAGERWRKKSAMRQKYMRCGELVKTADERWRKNEQQNMRKKKWETC